MDVAQYQLLRILRPLPAGPCHESLSVVLDGVHAYLSGAMPTKVVWLDERQQPPSLFDLEAVVDLVRPAPARLREAAATTCRG